MAWVIERGADGGAVDIAAYAFVEENEGFVTVSLFPYIEGDSTGTRIFPRKDVFETLEVAQMAFEMEMDGDLDLSVKSGGAGGDEDVK